MARERCSAALLLIDFINEFEFDGAERLFPRALAAARATNELRRRAKSAGIPAIYCNDNFGKWRSDFRSLLERCLSSGVRGEPIARLLRPEEDDYFVLKPKHSAFHATSLPVLLAHLGARTLVFSGVAGDYCVLFTAQDAYMEGYRVVVPRDCVASEPDEDNEAALKHLEKVCKAETAPSA
ncbi:MAG: cysteine hydrolase, partial [Betaproteobacteria bacterium]|nr:cysteine hydrolase [Betaproteobacteria bacterium]